ncbi:hypothetical protein ACH347_42975 [Saccharopolyspora sp. 5N102]|uniref:hypothetical protein n=1 Tax=Saccharopolyspora sp. 5N102 TaxID=3375155 RepID=UPI00379A5BAA
MIGLDPGFNPDVTDVTCPKRPVRSAEVATEIDRSARKGGPAPHTFGRNSGAHDSSPAAPESVLPLVAPYNHQIGR